MKAPPLYSNTLCYILSLCALIVCTVDNQAERLPIKSYPTADGLAHNHVNRIKKDSRGFLWFCTDEGLSRFDGSQFVNYTSAQGLPHPDVNDFLEARDGTIDIQTQPGTTIEIRLPLNPKRW